MRRMIQAAVWKADDLRPPEKFVALAIAARVDVLGNAHLSEQQVAEATGYAVPTVRRAVKRLLKRQVLAETTPPRPDRFRFTAQYSGPR